MTGTTSVGKRVVDAAVQRTTSTSEARGRSTRAPAARSQWRPTYVYTSVHCMDAGGPLGPRLGGAPRAGDADEALEAFEPGKRYKVAVCVDLEPPDEPQEHGPWRPYDEQTVHLSCVEYSDLVIEAIDPAPDGAGPVLRFRLEDVVREKLLTFVFEIEVPDDCPRQVVTLALAARRGESDVIVAERRVALQGERFAAHAGELAAAGIDPSMGLPANVASLVVSEHGAGGLQLVGFHSVKRFEERVPRRALSLAGFVAAQRLPSDVVKRVIGFSGDDLGEFHRWIDALLDVQGPDLVVIVVDATDAEIPWEMVKLRPRRSFLGAEAEVVRWSTVRHFGDTVLLAPREHAVAGTALRYLDEGSLQHMAPELAELERLGASSLDSLLDVKGRLGASLAGIGLLYLGCHGLFTYDSHVDERSQTLATQVNPGHSVRNLDLYHLESLQEDERPVVIVNACHSGRLLRDAGGAFGLPNLFLAKFARAYVGTLGPVNQDHASVIGARLLRAARRGEARLARELRLLRAEAAAALDLGGSPEEVWLRFLFAFMYVYYGNPLMRLTIAAPPAAADGGDGNDGD